MASMITGAEGTQNINQAQRLSPLARKKRKKKDQWGLDFPTVSKDPRKGKK